MPTAQTLIYDALLLCGVQAAGQSTPATQAQDALRRLNAMLSSWRLESLLVYAIDRQTFATVANQGTYTLGPGGNWDTTPLYGSGVPRPLRVDTAAFVDTSQTPVLEVPFKVLREDEYQDIRIKGLTSIWPVWLYYTADVPLGCVILWPIPTVTRQVALYLWHPLPGFPHLTVDVALSEGYEEAITFNLARRLAPLYNRTLLPETVQAAIETKAALMTSNSEPPVLKPDPLVAGGRGRFNPLTGEIV